MHHRTTDRLLVDFVTLKHCHHAIIFDCHSSAFDRAQVLKVSHNSSTLVRFVDIAANSTPSNVVRTLFTPRQHAKLCAVLDFACPGAPNLLEEVSPREGARWANLFATRFAVFCFIFVGLQTSLHEQHHMFRNHTQNVPVNSGHLRSFYLFEAKEAKKTFFFLQKDIYEDKNLLIQYCRSRNTKNGPIGRGPFRKTSQANSGAFMIKKKL